MPVRRQPVRRLTRPPVERGRYEVDGAPDRVGHGFGRHLGGISQPHLSHDRADVSEERVE